MDNVYVNGKFLTQKISGVQRYASELLRNYYTLNKEVKLVTPHNGLHNDVYQLPCERLEVGNKAGLKWEQWQLPRFAKQQGEPLLLNLCNVAPVAYHNKITCIHDIAFVRYPQFFSKTFHYYYKMLMPLIIRSSRHIITVSDFSKQELMQYYRLSDNQVSVVPNAGFPLLPATDATPMVRHPYFLFVGSADPRKNLLLLLQAYDAAQLTQTHLVVAGAGYKSFNTALLQQLEKYKAHPTIHFTGAVSNEQLAGLYQHAKAVIIPSVYEGFGLPVAEGLSAGCEVIANDIPIFREVAREHAFYFNNKETLTGLLLLLDKRDKRFNEEGLEYILTKYSWAQSARSLEQAIAQYR
ncbi:Glycosyltransferase Family 4 [Filimonas lacunae]|uniref:Glycosyltransferase Family 4 n=1 Tax=Filimonas lacunae TaxID=477680 RepID=A0A173MR63_9BACT|nr:glycosyltransferase family 1 protein [Filimonas lacunae]BAV10165.1 glycosyltransferase [Filimonas lacunae]SIT18676.1 Glycosyltransferase Family 4 [Filimonas lacunae]